MRVVLVYELFLVLSLFSLATVIFMWRTVLSPASQKLLVMDQSDFSKKWIIADVSSGHCDQLAAPDGWMVLYVGQDREHHWIANNSNETTGGDMDLVLSRAMFVDPGKVEGSLNTMRKNIVYLQAYVEKVEQILLTDCSVPVAEALRVLEDKNHSDWGMMYNETLLFNPYAHFGAWALIPRGAEHAKPQKNSRLYYVRDVKKVLVRHALSDQSTDTVVILPPMSSFTEGVTFDPSSPPVFVGQRSFTPVVPSCSMYHHEAFWAMLDPCLSSSPFCPVVRTLMQQRLFRELDAFSGYYQANASSRFNDSAEGIPLEWWSLEWWSSFNTTEDFPLDSLVSFLSSWVCSKQLSFYKCFRLLAHDLSSKAFVSKEENDTIQIWIAALESLGVNEPVRTKYPWRGVRTVSEVHVVSGSVKTRLESGGPEEEAYLSQLFTAPLRTFCTNVHSEEPSYLNVSLWRKPVIEDLVLIIVFNYDTFFWSNFYMLEATHRPFFKHIVYCVRNVHHLLRQDKKNALSHVILLEGIAEDWNLMYGCVTHVMEMNIAGVKGYVQIGDDVLLNPWHLVNESRNMMLLHECGQLREINKTQIPWVHWTTPKGRCALLRTLAGLEHISGVGRHQLLMKNDPSIGGWSKTYTEVFQANPQLYEPAGKCPLLQGTQDWPAPTKDQARRFMLNYYHVHKMAGKVRINGQDFLYVPHSVSEDFIPISRYFLKNRIMVELAVYNIQMGLSRLEERKRVGGTNSWDISRLQYQRDPATKYDFKHYYMHPIKLTQLAKYETARNFYCQVHLRNLYSELVKARGRH